MTSPTDGATFQDPASISLSAAASDPDGPIADVTFYAGQVQIGRDSKKPFTATWSNVGAGSYVLTAVARDRAGLTTTSVPVAITVGLPVSPLPPPPSPDSTPPTAAIMSPTAGAQVSGSVPITANATDDVGVTSVAIFVDDVSIGSDSTSPYSVVWNAAAAAPGGHVLRAEARDAANNVGTSATVSVTVAAANQPPAVSLTAPTSGASFTAPASVALNATASDVDGTIARVDFFAGSTLIGSDSTSPYAVTWAASVAGTVILTAKAFDNVGASTTSAGVTVTVTSPVQSTATFTPSTDNSLVQRYVLDVFVSTSNPATAVPASSQDLGKPAIVNGEMSADITSSLSALPAGTYVATVSAVTSSASTRSVPSAPFSVSGTSSAPLASPDGWMVEDNSASPPGLSRGASTSGSGDIVWVASASASLIAAFDAATGDLMGTAAVGLNPASIAVARGAGKVYVADEGSDTVSVVDRASVTRIATLTLPSPRGRRPHFVSSSPDARLVYVSEAGSNVVDVVDTATDRLFSRFAAGQAGSSIRAAIPDATGDQLYALSANDDHSSSTFAAIEVATGRWLWAIVLEGQGDHLARTADGRAAFVSTPETHSLRVIDLVRHAVADDISLGDGNGVERMQTVADGSVVVVLTDGQAAVLTATNVDIRKVSDRRVTHAVAPGTRELWFLNFPDANAGPVAVDPASGGIVRRFHFPGGGDPESVVFDPR